MITRLSPALFFTALVVLGQSVSAADTSVSASCSGNGSVAVYSSASGHSGYASARCGEHGADGPDGESGEHYSGSASGEPASKTISLEPFSSIFASGAWDFEVDSAGESIAQVSGDRRDVDAMQIRVENGRLIIEGPRNNSRNLRVRVSALGYLLRELKISGAGNRHVVGAYPNGLSLHTDGAGNTDLDIDVPRALDIRTGGAGNLVATGRASLMRIQISGAGNADLHRLEVKDIELHAAGSGAVSVCASERIAGGISGAIIANVFCEPELRSLHSAGASSINYQ